MKKWLGLLMVCCMLFTMMQPLAMASSSSAPTIAIGSVEVVQGSTDTQAVTVSIKNNPGLAALKIRVSYPTDTLELKSAEQGDIGSKFKDASFVTDNGVGNWNILSDKENVTGDGTLVTLTFAAKAGTQAGEYEISAKVEEAYDISDKNVTFTVEKGVFKVVASTTSGGGSTASGDKYDVTVVTPTNGTVTPDKTTAAKDETVTLTVAPNTGYELDALTVKGASASIETTKASDTTYTFAMPGEAVTVAATFKATTTPEPEKYDVTVTTPTNGTVTPDKDKAAKDETVTLTVKPDEGYKLDKLTVNGETINGTTFKMPAEKVTVEATFVESGNNNTDPAPSTGGNGCYIATSVYGSYDTPEVWTLRRFRDDVLGQTWYGRLFIKAYYATSPTLVRLFGDAEWFQNFWREKLDTLVQSLQDDGFESTPYQDKDW